MSATTGNPPFLVLGLNHRTAPVAVRERLAASDGGLGAVAAQLRALPEVREAVFVATCNRVEVYAVAASAGAEQLRLWLEQRAPGASVRDCLYEHHGAQAIRHMFRVAASLDSMVVGEPQILGQVKEAFGAAREQGAVGPQLHRLLSRAFAAAKRVRSETSIGEGSVSVASVAVDLASQIFGDLAGRRVLLVGAGKMALGAARALGQAGAKLSVTNRSLEKAEALAQERGGDAHPLNSLPMLLERADVVLCSTGASQFVLTLELIQASLRTRRGRPLFVIDISVPRNVDPRVHDLDGAYLFDVDDLEREVAQALGARGGVLANAEKILEEELRSFEQSQRLDGIVPTVSALRERFHSVAHGELEKALSGKLKHLSEQDRKQVEAMLDATVNKLLHPPTVALRGRAATDGAALAELVRELFQLPEPTSTKESEK